jgi:hypothetical protein
LIDKKNSEDIETPPRRICIFLGDAEPEPRKKRCGARIPGLVCGGCAELRIRDNFCPDPEIRLFQIRLGAESGTPGPKTFGSATLRRQERYRTIDTNVAVHIM